jgi:hypothetical protein
MAGLVPKGPRLKGPRPPKIAGPGKAPNPNRDVGSPIARPPRISPLPRQRIYQKDVAPTEIDPSNFTGATTPDMTGGLP